VIGLGLALALAGAVLIDGGYALQHASASRLPPLTLRRPLRSLRLLFGSGRWSLGFFGGIAGWGLYVTALRLAPLSLVQAVSAAGVAVLALGLGRLSRSELAGIATAVLGLALLGASLGSRVHSSHGATGAVVAWVVVSLAAAAVLPRNGPGLGAAAGVLYAAGDVATKAAVGGGGRLALVPVLLACHGLAFVCLQLAFQRGSRLATAGLAVLCTNALPIVAGTLLFAETPPAGWRGIARVVAFALVLTGAVALSRPPSAERSQPSPAPAGQRRGRRGCAVRARRGSYPT
jgi:hypothetical protein